MAQHIFERNDAESRVSNFSPRAQWALCGFENSGGAMTSFSGRIFIVVVLWLTTGFVAAAEGNSESFRQLPIQARETGYEELHTAFIRSADELDALLNKISGSNRWNSNQQFVKVLREAKIDFGSEALVLLCHSEGSGSVEVTLQKPVLVARRIVWKIERKVPEIGTQDMAYYCYAWVVKTADVQKVELQDEGKSILLSVDKDETAKKDTSGGK
jgi:hypothetical protein